MADHDVAREWARIVDWLQVMAPRSAAALRGPVGAGDGWGNVRRECAADLPDELAQLLAIHDGADRDARGAAFLPHGNRLMCVQEIAAFRTAANGLVDEEVAGYWWHPEWVPFATKSEGVMDCLFIDARVGPGRGHIGSFFDESGGELGWWPSLGAFLADTAGALEEVRPVAAWSPPPSAAVGVRPVLPQVTDDILVWQR
ncbi:SMI1/KNR4 family protein [Streptomyces sp. NPDC001691]|uniref:SMI1/KNR4 family protein n=1 Tax=Streptomyces sp. NPDC001691 TaxID=3364600 RepID=UPI00367DF345